MKTNQLLFMFLLLSTFCIKSALAEQVSELVTKTQPTNSNIFLTPKIPETIANIKEAKTKLNEVKLNFEVKKSTTTVTNKKTKKKEAKTAYNLKSKDIAVAIFNPQNSNIEIVLGKQNNKNIVFNTPNFDIKLVRFNGVNSLFKVNSPENATILAIKYLLTPTESSTNKSTIENTVKEVTYTPFSNNLNTPEVASYGANYLNNTISEAASQIAFLPSASDGNKKIIEVITPNLVKALIYAEHMNAGDILNTKNAKEVIDRLNTLFGINETDTYRYSVSSAGARGLAQFMPKTYQGLVLRHPQANLIPDFVEGMNDHVNATKAMYLLLDDYASAVKNKAKDGAVSGQLFDYGAASYNGGVTRVVKAVLTFGQHWNLPIAETVHKLHADVSSLSASVKNLTAQIKITKDHKIKADLQTQLDKIKIRENEAKKAVQNAKNSALRTETVVYLQKIYKVISVLEGN